MSPTTLVALTLLGSAAGQPPSVFGGPGPLPPDPPAAYPLPPLPPPGAPAAGVAPGVAAAPAGLPGCPPPAVHPFQRLPRICPALPCVCGDAAGRPEPVLWVKDFHDAAHFPLPRFAADGTPLCLDGLLIYEGMRLTVYPTGAYDVSFTATVPDMPVTIRLQLVLTEPAATAPRVYRLTLPPIRLEPRADVKAGDPTANTFHVAHRGFSALLTAPSQTVGMVGMVGPRVGHSWGWGVVWRPMAAITTPEGSAVVTDQWHLTRVGTARFGTPVAATDPFR